MEQISKYCGLTLRNTFIIITLALVTLIPSNALSQEYDENTLVIAFLERFTRFIENKTFPEFDDTKQDFKLYYIGTNTFGNKFDEIFKKQKIKNRRVKVVYVNHIEDIVDANMIFIANSHDKEVENIVKFANKRGILTTSYSKGFAKRGVHINLYMQDQKLKFEINHYSAKEAGFHISHLLLSKARIIK